MTNISISRVEDLTGMDHESILMIVSEICETWFDSLEECIPHWNDKNQIVLADGFSDNYYIEFDNNNNILNPGDAMRLTDNLALINIVRDMTEDDMQDGIYSACQIAAESKKETFEFAGC